jgi:hypothetical protein
MLSKGSRIPGWLLAACLLPAALLLAWLLLARLNFLYPVWYQVLAIEEHIALYAPQNRHGKTDFVETTPAEHRRLFAAIVQAIQGRGEPLTDIVYRDAAGRELGRFLQADEVGHLEDVRRLVALLTKSGTLLALAGGLLALLIWWRQLPLPPPGRVGLALLGLLLAGGALLALAGPQQVFDRLHEWVFPPEHPWFFYYQDSLMTTTLKAPQIFAAIAGLWTLAGVVSYLLIYAVLRRLLPAGVPGPPKTNRKRASLG